MAFINSSQIIIRKSNKDILNFFSKNNILFYREFIFQRGWKDSVKLIENLDDTMFDIKIDNKDNFYGIVITDNGEVLYLCNNKENEIKTKKLFIYDNNKYNLIYPFIKILDSRLHIIYYIQNNENPRVWALFHHYFDGNKWYENNIDFVFSYPFVNPYFVTYNHDGLNVFYLNIINGSEEIFISQFNPLQNSWSSPIQITETKNKKMYLNVLYDTSTLFHITWSEYFDNKLIVKYTNYSLNNGQFKISDIKDLSELSNCSYPTFIKVNNTLWNMWVQLDKLYSCYSIDNGNSWSDPIIDPKSYENNFIRYKFDSNYTADLNNFKLNEVFGIYNPKISFIGFGNV